MTAESKEMIAIDDDVHNDIELDIDAKIKSGIDFYINRRPFSRLTVRIIPFCGVLAYPLDSLAVIRLWSEVGVVKIRGF